MQHSYTVADSGVGAKYVWDGNRKVGSGTMEIVESTASNSIRVRLVLTKPFKAVNPTTFIHAGNGTQVTWTTTGENKGLGKNFALFMKMDKMIGADFGKGLTSLAAAAVPNAEPEQGRGWNDGMKGFGAIINRTRDVRAG